MDNNLLGQSDLLSEIKAVVSTWDDVFLKDRILPIEILNPLRKVRDKEEEILNENDLSDLGKFLGCRALDLQKDWSKRLLSCMCTISPDKRNGFCKRKFNDIDEKCRPLNPVSNSQLYNHQPKLFELQKDDQLPREKLILLSVRQKENNKKFQSWFNNSNFEDDRYPEIPKRLKSTLFGLAGASLRTIEKEKLCLRRTCNQNCALCLDGVMRGIWENRYTFFKEEEDKEGITDANYFLPTELSLIYNSLSSTPSTRLYALSRNLFPDVLVQNELDL